MTVTLVAAVGADGVIGRDGGLPWHLPGDLAHVKQLTLGHVLVMGRRTYESIGRPLPGRTTIVVTRRADWAAPGVRVARGVDEALAAGATLDDEVFVLGGASVYAAALPVADHLVLSEVAAAAEGDTYFPPVDWTQWRPVDRRPADGFTVVTYDRAPDRPVACSP
ncbi:MAG: dihydrofolate reductase [Nocardioidaceae bacterium]